MNDLVVSEAGTNLHFGFEDLLRYHGPGYPGGVAHGFKMLQRGLPLLAGGAPPERREISVETAFPGPGARDAIELVTRAVTGGRYAVSDAFAGPDVLASPRGRYLFRLIHRDTAVTLTLRPGHVRPEFVELARQQLRNEAEEVRLAWLKTEMAERLRALAAEEVYDAVVATADAAAALLFA